MELSEFLNTRKPYPSLPDDYKESAEWEESQYFNAWIKKYPECKHEEIIERLKYIRSYILLFPDFDGEQWCPSQDAISFYDNREQRIDDCGLSEDESNEFEILQESISDLGLSSKATFDFIVFIWHELSKWWKTQARMTPGAKVDLTPENNLFLTPEEFGRTTVRNSRYSLKR